MFEASLVESTGRIRTNSRRLAAVSFVMQAAVLAALIAWPILHPATLPRYNVVSFLAPPYSPPATHIQKATPASSAARPMFSLLQSARQIIHPASADQQQAQGAPEAIGLVDGAIGGSVPGAILGMAQPAMPHVAAAAPAKSGPARVSSGVAAGRLLTPITPQYPAIARQAHVQGTVVVHALISKSGQVVDAQVVSGPPMLAQAALSAVAQARYRPYLLNGEPVEVETTINLVFQLSE
ncbi:energy transducer TonB [Silvibacterium acidisoli]|uniref:energy transducer TonB n=1 Tax=Acidobacteriaceae bacterium ZG23-2 TaxID=2883246 RepID=UPI00406BF4AE